MLWANAHLQELEGGLPLAKLGVPLTRRMALSMMVEFPQRRKHRAYRGLISDILSTCLCQHWMSLKWLHLHGPLKLTRALQRLLPLPCLQTLAIEIDLVSGDFLDALQYCPNLQCLHLEYFKPSVYPGELPLASCACLTC